MPDGYTPRAFGGDVSDAWTTPVEPAEFGKLLAQIHRAQPKSEEPAFLRRASARTGGSVPTTVEEATAGAKRQDESYAAKILAAPYTGGQQVYRGASTLMQQPPGDVPLTKDDAPPLSGRQLARAGADIIGGGMHAGSIFLPEAIAANPWAVGSGLLAGSAAGAATHAAGTKLGVAPEYTDLASEVAGLTAGMATGHAFRSPESRAPILDAAKKFYQDESGELRLPFGEPEPTPTPEPVKPRGFYSRIDVLADKLEGGAVRPDVLAKLFDRHAIDPDEIAWRNLPALINGRSEPIPISELKSHLAANPAPFPKEINLGEETGGIRSRRPTFEQWLEEATAGGEAFENASPALQDAARRAYEAHVATIPPWVEPPSRPTENSRWTMAGGENYRERLFQLRQKPIAAAKSFRMEVRRPDGTVAWSGNDLTERQVQQMGETYGNSARGGGRPDSPYTLHVEPMVMAPAAVQPPGFESHVYRHSPDLIGWSRTNERTLPPPLDYNNHARMQLQMKLAGKLNEINSIPFSTSDLPQYHAAMEKHAQLTAEWNALNEQLQAIPETPGARVLHVEENQSDIHQRAEDEGYYTRPADLPDQIAKLEMEHARQNDIYDKAHEARVAAQEAFQAAQQRHTRTFLPEEYRHLTSFADALEEGNLDRHIHPPDSPTGPIETWRRAREQALETVPELTRLREAEDQSGTAYNEVSVRARELRDQLHKLKNPTGLPDLPFKGAKWERMMLARALMTAAADPTLEGVTLSSGRTQNERYNLGHYVSKLEYDPRNEYLIGYSKSDPTAMMYNEHVPLKDLHEHIGPEVADRLRAKVAEHQQALAYDRDQWSVRPDPDAPDRYNVIGPDGVPWRDGPYPMRFLDGADANDHIDWLFRREAVDRELPNVSGGDFSIGGEGMRMAYDKRQRRQLQSLIREHTHGVGDVTGVEHEVPAGSTSGPSHARREPTWLGQLTPEVRASINKNGFSLMALLLALQQANIGHPPPVLPPAMPSHDREAR